MIACHVLSSLTRTPHEPGRKLPVGPTDWRDPGGRDFVAEWQAHVAAGRIGTVNDLSAETREVILANERLIFGRQRTIIG